MLWLAILLISSFTQAAPFYQSTELGHQPPFRISFQHYQGGTNQKERATSLPETKGLPWGLIGVVLLIAFLLTCTMMRTKRGSGWGLRSLLSRCKSWRTKCIHTTPTTTEASLSYSDSAPTMKRITRSARCAATSSLKPTLPLEKNLGIFGLGSDLRAIEPIDSHQTALGSSPLPCSDPTCRPNHTMFVGPMVALPVMQDADAPTDVTGGKTDSEREEALMPPSPLLPPLPAAARSRRPRTPISPSPSRMTSTTRSSGVFPWGFESCMHNDASFDADRLSEDHILVLPSPPCVARFSAREG